MDQRWQQQKTIKVENGNKKNKKLSFQWFVPYDQGVLGGIVPKLGRKLIYLLFVDVTTAQWQCNAIFLLWNSLRLRKNRHKSIRFQSHVFVFVVNICCNLTKGWHLGNSGKGGGWADKKIALYDSSHMCIIWYVDICMHLVVNICMHLVVRWIGC